MVRVTRQARRKETPQENGAAKHTFGSVQLQRHAPRVAAHGLVLSSARVAHAEKVSRITCKGGVKAAGALRRPARNHTSSRNIIGRTFHRPLPQRAAKIAGVSRAHLPMLDQPSRQLRRGGLLHPLIQQALHIRAQIGGAVEPRKLIALQGKHACRQEKSPGRLGRGRAHCCLLGSCGDSTRLVIEVKYNDGVMTCA
jgi:hypothetical protein